MRAKIKDWNYQKMKIQICPKMKISEKRKIITIYSRGFNLLKRNKCKYDQKKRKLKAKDLLKEVCEVRTVHMFRKQG